MLTIREVIKTFYNALLQRLKKHRGNWEQNDPTADDYIKNRPFYTDENNVVVKLDKKYLPDLGLAPVAKSGNYDDLFNRPNIYSDVVRYGASQSLSASQKNVARNNIGAGTSSFSGSYNDLTDKPFPNCTTDNNGQFLRVVDGVATWSTIPNAEGVSF